MSSTAIQELARIGSKPLMPILDEMVWPNSDLRVDADRDLLKLLGSKNGFYAFESALHVFPVARDDWFNGQDLQRWNDQTLWKHAYNGQSQLGEIVFFAEDIVGVQFGLRTDRIVRFDPETGEAEEMCSSLNEWAEHVLSDYDSALGYSLAHSWQKQNGLIAEGNRLMPLIPLIAKESSFEAGNFYQINAIKGMLARADLAMQLQPMADGTTVALKTINI